MQSTCARAIFIVSIVLFTVVLLVLIFPTIGILGATSHRQAIVPPTTLPKPATSNDAEGHIDQHPVADQWKFDYRRDQNNHGLSEEQCTAAFPLLTKEVDRAVQYRQRVGNITLDDLDIQWRGNGILRVLITNNQLYIIDTLNVERGHRTRYLATLNSINTALLSYPGKLPDVEFPLTVQDIPLLGDENQQRVTLAYSRAAEQESLWLMPDFGFWAWPKVGVPPYSDLRAVIEDGEPDFMDKIPKLVWRGAVHPGEDPRIALLEKSKDKPWSDVAELVWESPEDMHKLLLTMEQHCDYMFTGMTEGITWSGRFKLLLNCHSVTVSHQLRFIEFYHHLLSDAGDSQNYVRLSRDFTGLDGTMNHLLQPNVLKNEAQRIADNARRTFREQYLTPAAISCYWRALFRGWASVQGFQPELWNSSGADSNPVGARKRRQRGTPFASYTIMEALEWEVPAQPRKLVLNDKTYY